MTLLSRGHAVEVEPVAVPADLSAVALAKVEASGEGRVLNGLFAGVRLNAP